MVVLAREGSPSTRFNVPKQKQRIERIFFVTPALVREIAKTAQPL